MYWTLNRLQKMIVDLNVFFLEKTHLKNGKILGIGLIQKKRLILISSNNHNNGWLNSIIFRWMYQRITIMDVSFPIVKFNNLKNGEKET